MKAATLQHVPYPFNKLTLRAKANVEAKEWIKSEYAAQSGGFK